MANEHDKRYKKLFSNPVLMQELLQYFVDEDFIKDLDFATLERLDKSFITDQFKQKESDLIYRINFNDTEIYIYLLLEFQSRVDKYMSLRMLRYICEFYEYLIQKKIKKLPPVFPILLYNGDAKWTAKNNIKELIEKTIPVKYIPDFSYYQVLENEISKKTLLGIKNAISAIFYIENSSPEEFKKELDKIFKLLATEHEEIVILFRKWFNNYLGYYDNDINEKISDLEEVKEMFATKLKKYGEKLKNIGKREGIKEGIKQDKIETAKKMLLHNYSINDIYSITGLSKDEIAKLKGGK